MDLVDLFYARFASSQHFDRSFLKKASGKKLLWLCWILLTITQSFFCMSAVAAEIDESSKSFSVYGELRDFVLSEVAKARTRVWLYTEYLTDGDVSSALFVAKYRKLDVQVLLGPQKSQGYMSRLSNLKSNQIEVFLKPKNISFDDSTVMLVDDRLIALDCELDFMNKKSEFIVNFGQTQDAYEFARLFALAMEQKKPAIAKQLPLVGRGQQGPYMVYPLPAGGPMQQKLQGDSVKNLAPHSHEAYHYSRIKEKKPPGVPDRLPRELKYIEREKGSALQPDP